MKTTSFIECDTCRMVIEGLEEVQRGRNVDIREYKGFNQDKG